MADLTELQASGSTKIAGANPSTGVEDNYLEVDTNGYIGSRLYDASGSAVTLGQKSMASSIPIVIASDQSTINVKTTSAGPVTPGAVAANSSLGGGQFNTVLPTLTNTQQAAIQLDASGRQIVTQSPSDNFNVQDVWDTSSVNGNVAVTTTPVRIKVGASELAERKVFYVQPQDGNIWIGSTSSVSSTIGNANVGVKVFKNQIMPMIFTDQVQMWMVTDNGTTNVSVIEGS